MGREKAMEGSGRREVKEMLTYHQNVPCFYEVTVFKFYQKLNYGTLVELDFTHRAGR